MNKKEVWITIGVVAIVCFCVWIIVTGLQARSLLNKSHLFTVGKIYSCRSGGRSHSGSSELHGYFYVQGNKIKLTDLMPRSTMDLETCRMHLVGKNFPVAYVPTDPSIAVFMITPKDFKRFKLPYPDSLKWV